MSEAQPGAVLSREDIQRLVLSEKPLIRDYVDLDQQLQPNGFDLTLAAVQTHVGPGSIAIDNADRVLPGLRELEPDESGFYHLDPGAYHITYGETVALPQDLMALGRPRSSVTRSGVAIHTAVWDAGYEGRSTSLLVVYNVSGFRVQRGARVAQLVFIRLSAATGQGYAGIYQGENQIVRS